MDNKASLELPSMLNYMRSINPSLGLLYGRSGDQRVPVEVRETTVRGTIGDFKDGHSAGDGLDSKLKKTENPNIQTIDTAFLPPGCDTLEIECSLTFLPHSLSPDVCNNAEYTAHIDRFVQRYKALGGYETLARLYLWNIVNGRMLWRNRFGDDKRVTIGTDAGQHDLNTENAKLSSPDEFAEDDETRRIIALISAALSGESEPLQLSVKLSVRLGAGQEVYPSQEFIQSSGRGKRPGDKSKTLASIPANKVERHAVMHSQKIGNAIRTIDIWHAEMDSYGPIAVEPYGVVQKRFAVARPVRGKTDLFSYLMRIDALTAQMDGSEIPGAAHYVMACLIRGGVYSGEGKQTKKARGASA